MAHLFISAAHKSSGKTTISIGLTAALSQAGYQIQTFKKGPDYIDPMWLGQASGRPCFNLDFYTMTQTEILNKFHYYMTTADLGLIEGNKGLYDGLDLDGSNSNAALATLLKAPVVLVLDSRGMTRGIAPLVLGYQQFDQNIDIRGVILNQVGGKRHESKLRSILEHYTDVKVIGAVHKDPQLNIDERHLGLIPSNEEKLAQQQIDRLADCIKEQVDLDKVISMAKTAPSDYQQCRPLHISNPKKIAPLKIGIFQDHAFGFYYPDDLLAMTTAGAELIRINSLSDSSLPEIDGLFIGGGFPETQMESLAANQSLLQNVKEAIESGLPVYAECGGLMYLSRSITWKEEQYPMANVIQGDIVMHDTPRGRGYIILEETENHPWATHVGHNTIKAHEFHYSELINLKSDYEFAYHVRRGTGVDGQHDGIIYKNLLANYGHLRNSQTNPWVERFLTFIHQHKQLAEDSAQPMQAP